MEEKTKTSVSVSLQDGNGYPAEPKRTGLINAYNRATVTLLVDDWWNMGKPTDEEIEDMYQRWKSRQVRA